MNPQGDYQAERSPRLTLHKDKPTFCETDISQKGDREELIKTIEWLVDLIFDKKEASTEAERIAINAHYEGFGVETISKITGLAIDRVQYIITG